jgi:hypothetical protein
MKCAADPDADAAEG